MATVLLAHSDPLQRESLAAKLGAKGFSVVSIADVEAALDAADGATALLVEPSLLLAEEMEVQTRIDLRAGRTVRIIALTHKAPAPEMAAFRRHGAGLLARPIEDVERLASMLRIQSTEDAPWEPGQAKPAPVAAKPSTAPWAKMPPLPAPTAQPWEPPPEEPKAEKKKENPKEKKKRSWWGGKAEDTGGNAPTSKTPAPPPAAEPTPVVPPPPVAAAPMPAKSPWAEEEEELYGEPDPPPAPPADAKPLTPPRNAPLDEILGDRDEEKTGEQSVPVGLRTKVSAPNPIPEEHTQASPIEPPRPPPPSAPAVPWDTKPKTPPPPVPWESKPPAVPWDTKPKTPVPQPVAWEPKPPALPWNAPPVAPRISDPSVLDAPSFVTPAIEDDGPTSMQPPPPPPPEDFAEHTVLSPDDDEATIASAAEDLASETRTSLSQIAPETRTSLSQIPVESFNEPTLASEHDEEATMATQELPDQVPEPPEMLESWTSDVDRAVNADGPSVLVVDDEATFRGFLRDALASRGYRVHTAINASNALRFLKSNGGIDLVISDLNMPHMDGFELKHEIDVTIGRKMPFIIVTADTSEEKIQTAAHVGAAALVPKPIEDLDAFHAIVLDTLKDAGIVPR